MFTIFLIALSDNLSKVRFTSQQALTDTNFSKYNLFIFFYIVLNVLICKPCQKKKMKQQLNCQENVIKIDRCWIYGITWMCRISRLIIPVLDVSVLIKCVEGTSVHKRDIRLLFQFGVQFTLGLLMLIWSKYCVNK